MLPEDLLRLTATTNEGKVVPLSAFASTQW